MCTQYKVQGNVLPTDIMPEGEHARRRARLFRRRAARGAPAAHVVARRVRHRHRIHITANLVAVVVRHWARRRVIAT